MTAGIGSGPAAAASELVTVVIPARNEEVALGPCLRSVLAQTHQRLEVLVVDGASTDRTAQIVEEHAARDDRVRLLRNPAAVIPRALNLAAEAARGRWFVRVDAHAAIPRDYVERVVDHLRTGRWGGVGGRKNGVGRTPAGRAVAAAMASRFGVGGSVYHWGTEPQVVDHIPFGAYPTELVRRLGGWDERLNVNEDVEFDLRVRRAGFDLLFDPTLEIAWECRQSVRDLARQYWRYGRGKALAVRIEPGTASPRHAVAPALCLWLLGALIASPRAPRASAAAVAPYATALAVASALVSRRVEPGSRRYVPAAFAAMHLSWGAGMWRGLLDRGPEPPSRPPS